MIMSEVGHQKRYSDSELLDRLSLRPFFLDPYTGRRCYWADEVQADYYTSGQWLWYDNRGKPMHKGWTAAKSLRDALASWLTASEELLLVSTAIHSKQQRIIEALERIESVLNRIKADPKLAKLMLKQLQNDTPTSSAGR